MNTRQQQDLLFLVNNAAPLRNSPNPERAPEKQEPREITAEMIPQGDDVETVKKRSRLLKEFYAWWMQYHPDRKVHNVTLNEDINVTYTSKHETSSQAARRYKSSLAVLRLDYILANAVPVLSDPADKKTKAQSRFERMLLMKCDCAGLGIVKLTVGVYRNSAQKEQYCITVIETEFNEAFKHSVKHNAGYGSGKKKTNRRKKPVR